MEIRSADGSARSVRAIGWVQPRCGAQRSNVGCNPLLGEQFLNSSDFESFAPHIVLNFKNLKLSVGELAPGKGPNRPTLCRQAAPIELTPITHWG